MASDLFLDRPHYCCYDYNMLHSESNIVETDRRNSKTKLASSLCLIVLLVLLVFAIIRRGVPPKLRHIHRGDVANSMDGTRTQRMNWKSPNLHHNRLLRLTANNDNLTIAGIMSPDQAAVQPPDGCNTSMTNSTEKPPHPSGAARRMKICGGCGKGGTVLISVCISVVHLFCT